MGTHEGLEKTRECLRETIGGDPFAIEKRSMMGSMPRRYGNREERVSDYCYL